LIAGQSQRRRSTGILSPSASAKYVSPKINAAGAYLEDLGSKNGTLLDGRKIDVPTRLPEGCEIHIWPVPPHVPRIARLRQNRDRGLAGVKPAQTVERVSGRAVRERWHS
jgi:hypothetical protein